MRIKLAFLLVIIGASSAMAQEMRLLGDYSIYFSDTLIKKNNIKSIRVESSTKHPNSRIEHTLEVNTFFFDTLGRIKTQIAKTQLDFINRDSSVYMYYYDLAGQLYIIRKYAALKYVALYFDYDSMGNCIKKTECSETNLNNDNSFFKLDKQKVNWFEFFNYERLSANQTKKKFYNDEQIIYKEGIIYTDEKKRIVEEDYKYTATSMKTNSTFKFGNNGRLIEKNYYSNSSGDVYEKSVFIEDTKNNNSKETKYRNNEAVNEIYYFYNPQSFVTEAIIDKNISNGVMYLKKFIVQ